MAHLSGVTYSPFSTVYKDLADTLQKEMLTYTEAIRQATAALKHPIIPGPALPRITLEINEDGYPLFPEDVLEKVRVKTELGNLLQQYMDQHYSR